jgi:hypothetical protein
VRDYEITDLGSKSNTLHIIELLQIRMSPNRW